MRRIAVVGGSLAGLSAARALRKQGYDGSLVLISDETGPPYDRPPLSKSFLAGGVSEAAIGLLGAGEDLDADWRTGVAATGLDPASRSVSLSDGSGLTVDGVVVATGARPRMPWPLLPGVQVLRTLDDALALRARLLPGARLVVVGAGFIGAEVASTAHALGLDVTVVEALATPMSAVLGDELGAVVAGLHAAHGVRLLCGVGVARLVGHQQVEGVELADGRVVPADVVLVGVGVRPNVEWLAGSGLPIADGVQCDAYGMTGIPTVVAVGDCASWYEPALGAHHRLEHWTGARERAVIAAGSLLSGGRRRAPGHSGRPPYFWSDQYGMTLQLTGRTAGADSVTVEEGAVADHDFLAVYRRAGEPVAVLALGQARAFMRWRKQLAAGAVAQPVAPH
ncbi:NAD(P)/FAD-dependent oxidoreductase [Jatrophihabitans sp.]|uniref:NAD(P)/FAD-dependent oxidoreductase n=1 Tax=Jatrophihabitans sp. TaxID=1932789 RepID=UPI002EFA78B1